MGMFSTCQSYTISEQKAGFKPRQATAESVLLTAVLGCLFCRGLSEVSSVRGLAVRWLV